jgi:hypothetical protein
MLNILLLRVDLFDDIVCIALKSRCEYHNIVFFCHVFQKLFSIISDRVMSGGLVELEAEWKDGFIGNLVETLRMDQCLIEVKHQSLLVLVLKVTF